MRQATIYKKNGKQLIAEQYEKYVASFDIELERMWVETSYGKTHVLVAGPLNAPPIFILQGGNCINPMTLSWFLPLARHYRVYAPDTIGHPGYSSEHRVSPKDASFAQWLNELMDFFYIERCAFVGPSYGAGIILRLATYMPEKIACAVLVAPAGIKLGSKKTMIQKILLPLVLFRATSSFKYLRQITDAMSEKCMKEMDRKIINTIFQTVKLEQSMPKLTTKEELVHYHAPTMIIAGSKDLFFPAPVIQEAAQKIIPNLIDFKTYEIGHFPCEHHLKTIQQELLHFMHVYYK